MSDNGHAPLSRPGQDFSVSFAEDQRVEQTCQARAGAEAIPAGSSWHTECLRQTSASDLGTTGEDFSQEAEGAEAMGGQPHGWVGPCQALLPFSVMIGASEHQVIVTDAEAPGLPGPEAGTIPTADVLPGSSPRRESLPGSLASAWESLAAPPEAGGLLPAAPSRPFRSAEPPLGSPPDELRPTLPNADSSPESENGAAPDVLNSATRELGEGHDAATRSSESRPAWTGHVGRADLQTGYRSEADPWTLPNLPDKAETATGMDEKHGAAHDPIGTMSNVAESPPRVGSAPAGFSQTGIDPNVLSVEPGSARGFPAGHAFGPEEMGDFGSRTTGSIWERAFLDLLQSHVSGMSQPVANGSGSALTSAETAIDTVTEGLPLVPADGLAKPVQVSVVPAGGGAPWLTARMTVHNATASPTLPLAEGSMANPKAGLLVEAFMDRSSDQEAGADAMLAPGIIGSSASPGSQHAIRADLVSHQFSQVAAQLASVLRRSSSGATELALAPAELGNVRLQMEPDARDPDRLIVVITIERPETLDLFRRHAGELAEAIRNAGYSGSSIDFGQDGKDRRTDGRQDDREGQASSTIGDNPRDKSPMRHVIGESLDLRV